MYSLSGYYLAEEWNPGALEMAFNCAKIYIFLTAYLNYLSKGSVIVSAINNILYN